MEHVETYTARVITQNWQSDRTSLMASLNWYSLETQQKIQYLKFLTYRIHVHKNSCDKMFRVSKFNESNFQRAIATPWKIDTTKIQCDKT